MIWLYSPVPSVWPPGANQYVLPACPRSIEPLLPAGTTSAPVGGLAGPLRTAVLPQIRAGGALGQDPLGADSVGDGVAVVVLVVGDGAVVVVLGAVGEDALGEGALVVGAAVVAVVDGSTVGVVGVGAALVVVVDGVGLG